MKLSELFGREDLKEKFVLQKFLCEFLSCSREELRMDMDRELSDEIIQKTLIAYKSYVEDKRPLEFILGHVDFFGREFFVNEATLIPRPETEYMITATTEFIQQIQDTRYKMQESDSDHVSGVMYHKSNILLDIGTGCGVLGISVLLQNPGYFGHAVLTDYFDNALEIAKKNYETYKGEILAANSDLKVEFFQSDLLTFLTNPPSASVDIPQFVRDGLSSKNPSAFGTSLYKGRQNEAISGNVILVANLPYIPEEMFEANVADNVKKFEPKPAFVGGDDGLDYYRTMFQQTFQLIENGKLKIENGFVMFLEMMTWQVDILRQEFGDKMEFEEVKTFHFNIRIVKAWLK